MIPCSKILVTFDVLQFDVYAFFVHIDFNIINRILHITVMGATCRLFSVFFLSYWLLLWVVVYCI